MINLSMRINKIVKPVLILIILAVIFQYFRPLPQANPVITLTVPAYSISHDLSLPNYGQSALLLQNSGLLVSKGPQQPVPLASIAKVITSLAILEKKPLQKDQTGPNITMTKNDVAIYNSYLAKDGSSLKIVEGESLNEYEALQAMLLPSANNIAESMAIWAFGSVNNYVSYANKMVAAMGLVNTKIADASGFSNASISTAVDLVRLGQVALNSPVLSEIVAQPSAVLPIAGQVFNVNSLLGNDGVIGIKTGNTDQAGGCYLFATKQYMNGQNLTLIGAIMSAPNLQTALQDSKTLIESFGSELSYVTIVKKGQTVGYYKTPWGTTNDIIASNDASIITWKNDDIKLDNQSSPISISSKSGKSAGKIIAQLGNQKVYINTELKNNFSAAPWTWRLLR